ncbi:MAG TPA: surface-adhesin E family protein [Gemmatimonadaceae bacterium]|nr:surface-adhesin E family protein [Gemmatimonadaceae bacterium]
MLPRTARLALLLLVPLLASLVASAPAAAQQKGRWRQIGTTSSGNPVYLDPKSVSRANGIVTATVRVQFVEPVQTGQGAWTSARTIAMFDCAHQTVAVKENTYFLDEKHNRIAQHKVVGKPGFGTTIKGTLADVALLHLCKAGK